MNCDYIMQVMACDDIMEVSTTNVNEKKAKVRKCDKIQQLASIPSKLGKDTNPSVFNAFSVIMQSFHLRRIEL